MDESDDLPCMFGQVDFIIAYHRKFWSLVGPGVSKLSMVPQNCNSDLSSEKIFVVDYPNVLFHIYI